MLTITYNAQYCPKRHRAARKAHVAAFDRLATLLPEAIGVEEAGGYRRELRNVTGYTVIQPHGAAGKCALLIRNDVTVHDHGTVKLHGRKFVGRDVPGARRTGITSARHIVWALITDPDDGQRKYVAVWHPVPGQSHSTRARALLADEASVAGRWLAGLDHPADLMGDCNGTPELALFHPLRTLASPAFAPSRHGDPIDGHWIVGGTGKARALDGFPSDHKPVAADITWAAKPAPKPEPTPQPHKEPSVTSIDLVDLSHWQDGHMGFAKLRDSGTHGVYHKATEGTGFTDPGYRTRHAQVGRTKKMRFGAYHFAKATDDAAAQARHFLAVADPKPGNLRPMLDLEEAAFGSWSVKRRTEWVREWVNVVKAATGVPPVIYTHFNLNHHFDCPLWVARYSNAMSAPAVPKPWSTWSIWQFSNGQFGHPDSAPGVGHVDLSTFNSGITLDVLTIPSKAAPTPEPKPAAKPEPAPAPPPAPKRPYHEQQAINETRTTMRNATTHGHKARANRFRQALNWLLGRKQA